VEKHFFEGREKTIRIIMSESSTNTNEEKKERKSWKNENNIYRG
jgi:hypothetical protein